MGGTLSWSAYLIEANDSLLPDVPPEAPVVLT